MSGASASVPDSPYWPNLGPTNPPLSLPLVLSMLALGGGGGGQPREKGMACLKKKNIVFVDFARFGSVLDGF